MFILKIKGTCHDFEALTDMLCAEAPGSDLNCGKTALQAGFDLAAQLGACPLIRKLKGVQTYGSEKYPNLPHSKTC